MGQIVVVVAFGPLDVDVVGQDLDVVINIVNREGRSANIFQADPIGVDGLVTQAKILLIEGVVDLTDVGQTGITLLRGVAGILVSASDANVFPPIFSRGHGALGDSILDNRTHPIREGRL